MIPLGILGPETGTDILTQLTGLYGDRMGQPISNSYRYFNPFRHRQPPR